MPFASIKQIKVPPRQRKAVNRTALDALKNDILQNGLIHPIAIDNEFNLLAGGRRLQAISELAEEKKAIRYLSAPVPLGEIPCGMFINNISPLQAKEIELNENLLRENLSWQEETKALAEIHKLRKDENPAQTLKQTSEEIIAKNNSSQPIKSLSDKISRALVTEKFLDREEVKNAGNEKLAFNAAVRIARDEFAEELAKRRKKISSPHHFLCGDARLEIRSLKQTFRCFILDPPYGISANAFGNAASGRHTYEDGKDSAFFLTIDILDELTEKAAKDAHLWLFCDIDFFVKFRTHLTATGWNVSRTPLIWNSGTSGHVPNQKIAIRRNYELILFATRSDRGLAQLLDDVISINAKDTNLTGASKPDKLYELLIKLSTIPGDHILDPTCGSGTIFRAAELTSTIATGIELDEKLAKANRGLIAELASLKGEKK